MRFLHTLALDFNFSFPANEMVQAAARFPHPATSGMS
jgi:hypothetical protein